jgi:hypothetical protein
MAGGAGSKFSSQHLCVTSQNTDPRAVALLRSAHDLGITALTGIDISDLVFFRGSVHEESKQLIESLLVDSLLQQGEWNLSNSTDENVVETALHPGVTDSTSDELQRVIRRMDLPIDGVASGDRKSTRLNSSHDP